PASLMMRRAAPRSSCRREELIVSSGCPRSNERYLAPACEALPIKLPARPGLKIWPLRPGTWDRRRLRATAEVVAWPPCQARDGQPGGRQRANAALAHRLSELGHPADVPDLSLWVDSHRPL